MMIKMLFGTLLTLLVIVTSLGGFRTEENDDRVGLKSSPEVKFEILDEKRFEQGRTELKKIQQYSERPSYGHCWTGALQQVFSGCKKMSDSEQRVLALEFSKCHLQSSGRKGEIQDCDPGQSFEDCAGRMTDLAFSTYTEFFTHTQDICFFLANQIWHENTEQTINLLSEGSASIAAQLRQSTKIQEEMIRQQNQSLHNQEEMIEKEEQFEIHLERQQQQMHQAFDEMNTATNQQRKLFAETFDKVASLQEMVLGEFTSFYSMLYFAIASFLCYLLTSARRTSTARVWLFLILAANLISERFISRNYWGHSDQNLLIYEDIWLCRKLFCVISALVLLVFAITYKDYLKINHNILRDIQSQLCSLREAGRSDVSGLGSPYELANSMFNCSPYVVQQRFRQLSDDSFELPSLPSDDHDASDDETSSDTDAIFSDSDLSDVDYYTAESRRTSIMTSAVMETTPLGNPASSSPVKQVGHLTDSDVGRFNNGSPSPTSIVSPSRRTSKSGAVQPVTRRLYNLRPRPTSPIKSNPVITRESPTEFGGIVKRNAMLSKMLALSQKSNTTCPNPSFFSSDDEC